MRGVIVSLVSMMAMLAPVTACGAAQKAEQARAADPLKDVLAGSIRSDKNRARDTYRHPTETLNFFGLKPGMTVVEIWSGGGWYSEVLAPYAAATGGRYVAAERGDAKDARAFFDKNPALAKASSVALFPYSGEGEKVADGSADMVLTFRNVHNWAGAKEPYADEAFRQMFAMLKPGGTLGVVDHRMNADDAGTFEGKNGYMKEATIKKLAEDAGFKFVAASEINANPKDTKDYDRGVWTLPPTLRLGDTDKAKYLAIGESDRMTLKFVKPAK